MANTPNLDLVELVSGVRFSSQLSSINDNLAKIDSKFGPERTAKYLPQTDFNTVTDEWALISGPNSPDDSLAFFYVNTIFYSKVNNIYKQIAYGYSISNPGVFSRECNKGVFTAWGYDSTQSVHVTDPQAYALTLQANGMYPIYCDGSTINIPDGYSISTGFVMRRNTFLFIFLMLYNGEIASCGYNGGNGSWYSWKIR